MERQYCPARQLVTARFQAVHYLGFQLPEPFEPICAPIANKLATVIEKLDLLALWSTKN